MQLGKDVTGLYREFGTFFKSADAVHIASAKMRMDTIGNIAQSIGSDSAAVTGFAAPNVVSGSIYSSTDELSVIRYGIYVDNVEIADSNRAQTHTHLVSGWPMSIQTIATVTAGQVVTVKTTVPTGGFSIGPAMALTLIPITN
jgi:hypothetical protein